MSMYSLKNDIKKDQNNSDLLNSVVRTTWFIEISMRSPHENYGAAVNVQPAKVVCGVDCTS